MLKSLWLVAACLVLGVAGTVMAGGGCLISDDFSGGGLTDIWQTGGSSGSVVSVTESGGRVKFSGSAHNDESLDMRFVLSSDWYMDMTQDWAISGWWYSNPPTPTWGDTGIAIGVILDGTPSSAYLKYGATMSVGRYRDSNTYFGYQVCNTWWNNDYSLVDIDYPFDTTSDTVYVWYDASSDTLYFGDVLNGGSPFSVNSFQSGSPSISHQAWIGFGAYSTGEVPSFSSKYQGDNFCVLYGNVVGPAVGACCSGFACVETIAESCAGVWQGAGTSCDTACGAEGACCVGTACQTLTAAECADASGSYHGDGVSCAATPCGGGAGCPAGWSEDCMGICFPDAVFEHWGGDTYCDNGAYIPANYPDEYDETYGDAPPGVAVYMNCDAHLCDDGDCIGDEDSDCGPVCAGDVNADGVVGREDLLSLILVWGTTHAYADVDGDFDVGVQDLLAVCAAWGPC